MSRSFLFCNDLFPTWMKFGCCICPSIWVSFDMYTMFEILLAGDELLVPFDLYSDWYIPTDYAQRLDVQLSLLGENLSDLHHAGPCSTYSRSTACTHTHPLAVSWWTNPNSAFFRHKSSSKILIPMRVRDWFYALVKSHGAQEEETGEHCAHHFPNRSQ